MFPKDLPLQAYIDQSLDMMEAYEAAEGHAAMIDTLGGEPGAFRIEHAREAALLLIQSDLDCTPDIMAAFFYYPDVEDQLSGERSEAPDKEWDPFDTSHPALYAQLEHGSEYGPEAEDDIFPADENVAAPLKEVTSAFRWLVHEDWAKEGPEEIISILAGLSPEAKILFIGVMMMRTLAFKDYPSNAAYHEFHNAHSTLFSIVHEREPALFRVLEGAFDSVRQHFISRGARCSVGVIVPHP